MTQPTVDENRVELWIQSRPNTEWANHLVAKALRAHGWSYGRIARRLGVCRNTAQRWVDYQYAEKVRAWGRAQQRRRRKK